MFTWSLLLVFACLKSYIEGIPEELTVRHVQKVTPSGAGACSCAVHGPLMDGRDANVTDAQLEASSFRRNHEAYRSKFSVEQSWIPQFADPDKWIQVDLLEVKCIKAVVTQGSVSPATWIRTFSISYSSDGILWNAYTASEGEARMVFTGNVNGRNIVWNNFPSGLLARYVQLRPESCYGLCKLNWDIIGCIVNAPMASTITLAADRQPLPPLLALPNLQESLEATPVVSDGNLSTCLTGPVAAHPWHVIIRLEAGPPHGRLRLHGNHLACDAEHIVVGARVPHHPCSADYILCKLVEGENGTCEAECPENPERWIVFLRGEGRTELCDMGCSSRVAIPSKRETIGILVTYLEYMEKLRVTSCS